MRILAALQSLARMHNPGDRKELSGQLFSINL